MTFDKVNIPKSIGNDTLSKVLFLTDTFDEMMGGQIFDQLYGFRQSNLFPFKWAFDQPSLKMSISTGLCILNNLMTLVHDFLLVTIVTPMT